MKRQKEKVVPRFGRKTRADCGHLDHITIDELKARAVGENFDGSCPACGMFPLIRADNGRIVSEKICATEHYAEMKRAAEQP